MTPAGRRPVVRSRRDRTPRLVAPLAAASLALLAWMAPRSSFALDDEREGTPRAAAPDQIAGQLFLRGGVELVGPVGSVTDDVAVDDVAATGVGASIAAGLGISRSTELVLSGGFAVLEDPARCDPCGGSTARVGVGLAYHLAQGTAMDPWARWGIGVRTTEVEGEGATSRVARELVPGRYHGVDFTQLALGTTWSPVAGFGFGPYVAMDLGTYAVRPDGADSSAIYAFFTAGIAVQLTPGRSGRSEAGSSRAAAGADAPGDDASRADALGADAPAADSPAVGSARPSAAPPSF